LVSGASYADERRPESAATDKFFEPVAIADGPTGWVETGELEESAYDIPGEIVVDARDDLDGSSLRALAGDFGLSFSPTALENETKIEIAWVGAGRIDEVLARLRRDARVEVAEPLARVRAFFVPNDPLMKEQWHLERIGASRAWDFA